MTSAILIAAMYGVIFVWALIGSLRTTDLVLMICAAQLVTAITYGSTFHRHQKLYEWFANHVRLERSKLPEDAPKDLIEKEDDED